jgi:hypothetical protein
MAVGSLSRGMRNAKPLLVADPTAPPTPAAPIVSEVHCSGVPFPGFPQTGDVDVLHKSPRSTLASRMAVAFQGQERSADIGDRAYATLAFELADEAHTDTGTQRPRVVTVFSSVGGAMGAPFMRSKGRQPSGSEHTSDGRDSQRARRRQSRAKI